MERRNPPSSQPVAGGDQELRGPERLLLRAAPVVTRDGEASGRPGEREAALKSAGVQDFVYVGCDVLAVLARLSARSTVSPQLIDLALGQIAGSKKQERN